MLVLIDGEGEDASVATETTSTGTSGTAVDTTGLRDMPAPQTIDELLAQRRAKNQERPEHQDEVDDDAVLGQEVDDGEGETVEEREAREAAEAEEAAKKKGEEGDDTKPKIEGGDQPFEVELADGTKKSFTLQEAAEALLERETFEGRLTEAQEQVRTDLTVKSQGILAEQAQDFMDRVAVIAQLIVEPPVPDESLMYNDPDLFKQQALDRQAWEKKRDQLIEQYKGAQQLKKEAEENAQALTAQRSRAILAGAEGRPGLWPDLFDEQKGPKIRDEIASYLAGVGFSQEELKGMVDHRMYAVVKDALAYRAAKKAAPKITRIAANTQPLPKTSGTAPSASDEVTRTIQALQLKVNRGEASIDEAVQLRKLRRKSQEAQAA